MGTSVISTEAEATTLFGARSKTASMTGRALLAGVAIIIASCGGSSSDSAPSSSAADEAAVADSNEDVAAVRAALEENADEPIPFGDDALDCVAEKVAADADLTAQVLADDVVDDAALVRITTTCAPEALASMLTDDPMFASLTDEEALCVVEAMADNPELLDELDEMALAAEMFSCAPTVMASMFADETGLTEAEAECILSDVDDFGALIAMGDMEPDATDADAMAAMGGLFETFIACDISLETLAELGGAGDLGGDESSNSDGGSDSSAEADGPAPLVVSHPIADLGAMWASQPFATQDNDIGIQFHNGVDYFVTEPEVTVLSAVSGTFQDVQVMERQPDGAFQVNLMIITDSGEVVTYSLEPSAGPADSAKIAEQAVLSQQMFDAMSVQRGDRVEIGQPIGVLLGQDEWAHVHMTVKQSNDQPEIWLCPMDFMVAEERDELLEPTQVWANRLYNGSKNPALCND
ncbi:MAG: hypothetical protein ACPHHT_07365 [Ilumatobacteraceae bacterium]